jgi:hypothetical protein
MLEEYPRRVRETSSSGRVLIICTEPPHRFTGPSISVWRALALMTETCVVRIASVDAGDPLAIPRTAAGEAIAAATVQFESTCCGLLRSSRIGVRSHFVAESWESGHRSPAAVDETYCRQIRNAREAISAIWVDDEATRLRLAAAVSGIPVNILRAEGGRSEADGGRSEPNGEVLPSDRSFEVVAKTLGLGPSTEAEEAIARRLRHNLSMSRRIIFAHYNPWTRLFWIELEVLGDIPANTISGFFEVLSGENLANA